MNSLPDLTTITLMGAWGSERQREFNLLRVFLKENIQEEESLKRRGDGIECECMIGVTVAVAKGGRLKWVNEEI